MTKTPLANSTDYILEVTDLQIDLTGTQTGLIRGVSFAVPHSGAVALIGESGCGKTMTAMALLGLLPDGVRVAAGSAALDGVELLTRSDRQMSKIRGRTIGTVFQEPMSTLDPTMTVGDQIAESRRLHLGEARKAARKRALELLQLVGIPNAEKRLDAYPHEMSGGMQQRVGIAAAIACDPPLLIADEPTTALDVTVQAEILELLGELREQKQVAVLLVTHDLGVVADFCDDVVVMYAGGIAERADVFRLFRTPAHPYTKALIDTVPGGAEPFTTLNTIPGRVPSAGSFPEGCRFEPRCAYAVERCRTVDVYEAHRDDPTTCLRVAAGGLVLEGDQ
ncbi:MAG: ABC transporter ATP-binding protein [Cumulibacter sp.]